MMPVLFRIHNWFYCFLQEKADNFISASISRQAFPVVAYSFLKKYVASLSQPLISISELKC